MLTDGRRVCLALSVKVEFARAAGAKTLTPELVLTWIAKVDGRAVPEEVLSAAERVRFHLLCTMGEVAQLLVQYDKLGLVDLAASAERRLAGQMPRGSGISAEL